MTFNRNTWVTAPVFDDHTPAVTDNMTTEEMDGVIIFGMALQEAHIEVATSNMQKRSN